MLPEAEGRTERPLLQVGSIFFPIHGQGRDPHLLSKGNNRSCLEPLVTLKVYCGDLGGSHWLFPSHALSWSRCGWGRVMVRFCRIGTWRRRASGETGPGRAYLVQKASQGGRVGTRAVRKAADTKVCVHRRCIYPTNGCG